MGAGLWAALVVRAVLQRARVAWSVGGRSWAVAVGWRWVQGSVDAGPQWGQRANSARKYVLRNCESQF